MKSAVVVISIDGFSAALFRDASVKVPTLRALAARGVAAARAGSRRAGTDGKGDASVLMARDYDPSDEIVNSR